MSAKTSIRTKPRAGEKRGFLENLLDPIDRLSETIFSILAVSTFTLTYKIFRFGGDPSHEPSAEYAED